MECVRLKQQQKARQKSLDGICSKWLSTLVLNCDLLILQLVWSAICSARCGMKETTRKNLINYVVLPQRQMRFVPEIIKTTTQSACNNYAESWNSQRLFFSARLYCVVVSLWNPYFQKMKVTNHICIFFWNLWKINLCENRNCKLGWSTWSGLFRICGNLRRFSSAASMLLTRIVKKMWKKGNLNKLKHVFLISSGLQDRYLQTICYTLLKISQNADYMPT